MGGGGFPLCGRAQAEAIFVGERKEVEEGPKKERSILSLDREWSKGKSEMSSFSEIASLREGGKTRLKRGTHTGCSVAKPRKHRGKASHRKKP